MRLLVVEQIRDQLSPYGLLWQHHLLTLSARYDTTNGLYCRPVRLSEPCCFIRDTRTRHEYQVLILSDGWWMDRLIHDLGVILGSEWYWECALLGQNYLYRV